MDRAAFTYESITLESSGAIVALEMEIKVGLSYFTVLVGGNIPAYTLPSGDILYEGPLSGSMVVGEDEYRATVGFIKLASSDAVMLSVTLQNDNSLVAFSLGENIIQDEVLEFFTSKQVNNVTNNIELNTEDISFSNPDESSEPSSVLLPIGPILYDPPGGGGSSNLGPNGEWKFQGTDYKNHAGTTYKSVQTRIYYDESSSNLIVTIKPCISDTEDFSATLGTVSATLINSLTVELEMTKLTGTMYANIGGYSIPRRDEYTVSFLGFETIYLYAFVRDFLAYCSIPSNVLSALQSSIHGAVTVEPDMHHTTIDIDFSFLSSTNTNLIGNINPGLPFLFNLKRGNPNTYTGDTPYVVSCTVEYCILLGSPDSATPTVLPLYYSETVEYEGTIDVVG